MSMNVNGITGTDAASAYSSYNTTPKAADTTAKTDAATNTQKENGVVYEPSTSKETEATAKTYRQDTALIAKLKADADARTAQFKSLVEQLISKQSTTYGQATDIWSFLSKGEFTVDAATKEQAQKDIAEDGYWGVEKTSSRIVDFATALTGGDPDKIESMRDAFKTAYEQAEKTWGGELPEISKKTYEAVMKKFDDLAEKANPQKTTQPDPVTTDTN